VSQIAAHRAEHRSVPLASATVAVLDAAPAGDRPLGTALLVPGFTGSKEDFAALLDPLSEAGFRVVSLDLPGQYESPGPDDRRAYTPDWLGSVVNELAASLGDEPVHLLGHSFGGLVARAAVVAAPRRYRSLILLCSGPAAIDGGRREAMTQLEPFAKRGTAAVYAARMEADPPGEDTPAGLGDFLRERFLASSLPGLLGMADSLLREPDRVGQLRATGVPVLVCFGDADDAWSPAEQRDMADRLDARVTVIAHAGHSPAVDQPEETAASLATFWSNGSR
jgi:pimeloyl-ACP methyl ester carboxylesterase